VRGRDPDIAMRGRKTERNKEGGSLRTKSNREGT